MRLLSGLALLSVCLAAPPVRAQVINELIVNHLGSPDQFDFVEIFGDPSTDYSDLTILEVDGDATGNPGRIDSAWPVGSTDADGFWWTGFLGEEFPTNDSLSFVLVRDFSGSAGVDVDPNDDGVLDSTPWSEALDAVGIDDGDASDRWYGGATVLSPNFDGVSFVPAGLSRTPNGTDTESVGDWTRNDFDGAGLPGMAGFVDPGEVENTPGEPNPLPVGPQTPLISEVLADHAGADTFELVEIFGEPQTDHSAYTLLVVEGDLGENPGQIDNVFPCGTTSTTGFWSTAPLAEEIEDFSTKTFLLVEGFSGAQLDDVDTDDDGTFDSPPWTALHDSVALSDGGGIVYSAAVVTHPGRSIPAPGGASRFPWFVDTDSAADWVLADFDGAGVVTGSIAPGEAYVTPGSVNRIHVSDYWAPADASDGASLRASLHGIVDDHVKIPYTSSAFPDTWDVLESADEDADDPGAILDVYRNASYGKEGGGNSFYNREHSWPRTYGFSDDGPGVYPYSDCHHLFLSDIDYNSDRGSKVFATCDPCLEDPTEANGGVGGGSGTYPGWSNWFTAADGSNGSWETWRDRRGDLARAQLYMDVRYEGGVHGESGASEPDLVLTDQRSLIQSTSGSPAYMGLLAVLLEWHAEDPVDAKERRRNDAVWLHQGNRNPFIDHPEWVSCVFEGVCSALFADGFESGDLGSWSSRSTSATPR